jgi:ATP-dependent DNA ligase
MITYPARPTNGGPIDQAVPKVGDWVYEPKYNGWRALVHVPTSRVWNRHGVPLSIANKFDTALDQLKETDLEWADCEALERRHDKGRGSLIVFDTPMRGQGPTYKFRKNVLNMAGLPLLYPKRSVADLVPPKAGAYICPVVLGSQVKAYWKEMKEYNEQEQCEFFEGLVAKKVDSKYHIQLRSPNEKFGYWIKHRFKA